MKYMGNKNRIADEILSVIGLNDNDVFVDLFCGSLSVTQRAQCNTIIANDKNVYLIEMWKALLDGERYPRHITKELYSRVRDSYNKCTTEFDDAFKGWIGWMGSYNGRFFDGGYSGHDVNGRDYIGEQIRNTLNQLEQLKNKNITLLSSDYEDVTIPQNAIVYCDIPYKGTKQYATSKNFDYEKFYDFCRNLHRRGNKVYISEYDMPSDFTCVWEKCVTNAMHQTSTKKPTEKLFTIIE